MQDAATRDESSPGRGPNSSQRWNRLAAAVLLGAAVGALGCAAPPRWRADDAPSGSDVEGLFSAEGSSGVFREISAAEIPLVPVRANLRPCCAFGDQLGVRLGPLPIPWFRVPNIVDPDRVGLHVYDSGVAQVSSRGDDSGVVHSENDGLVYTCRGGFIDTAHVRDYADWTIFFATTIARNLESGVEVTLPEEGGVRTVTLRPVEPAVIQRVGRRAIAIPLGQWIAFQLSTWHEIATWFGWSSIGAFPERVSAFSPEDLYSNLLGTRLAAAVASQRTARDEYLYNRSLDQWLKRALDHLGAVSSEAGLEAIRAVDGVWWDSSRRLPDMALVTRRNLETGPMLEPWLVPSGRVGEKLRSACGADPAPQLFANPQRLGEIRFRDYVMLNIEPPANFMEAEPFKTLGPKLSQDDFPAIIEVIRAGVRRELGGDADQPM